MKNYKKMKLIMAFFLALMVASLGIPSISDAAAVGDQLKSPENGWSRYDDTNSLFSYEGAWTSSGYGDSELYYNNSNHVATVEGSTVTFTFKGSKLRIIGSVRSDKSNTMNITIDGATDTFSAYATTGLTQVLLYEKTNLTPGYHQVTIKFVKSSSSVANFVFDAIDIDANGELLDPDYVEPEPTPTATPEPTFEPTPTPEQPTDNRAILVVTLTTGLEKEYDLSMQEVNAFIDWYEAKQEGTGKASYAIDKHENNKGPFKSRKDYILFDRILTFEVSEY
ncbi:bacterial surface protein [Paenibacillus sp. CAU 1782]